MDTAVGEGDTLRSLVGNSVRTLVFVVAIAILAFVQLPYPFLPSTVVSLQSIGVFLAGIVLGPVWGTAAVVSVLLTAAAGMPVLHGGAGLDFLLSSPKTGYFLSYPIAAAAIGYVVHRGVELQALETVSVKTLLGALVVGLAITNLSLTVGYVVVMNAAVVDALLITTPQYIPVELVKIGVVIGIVRTDLFVAG